MRVIICEDHSLTARLYGFLLEERGHTVEVVTNRFERLISAHWPWERFDVAVVDLRLPPGIQGEDILRWLADHHPEVRTVAVTGSHRKDSGAEVLLVKPVTAEEFVATVEAPSVPQGRTSQPSTGAGGEPEAMP